MWQHQAGRFDFEEPLLQLVQRGWAFREYAPLTSALAGGSWVVIGVEGSGWVKVDRPERRDAWAEAVRLASIPAIEGGRHAVAARSATKASLPDDPTVCDEERADAWGRVLILAAVTNTAAPGEPPLVDLRSRPSRLRHRSTTRSNRSRTTSRFDTEVDPK